MIQLCPPAIIYLIFSFTQILIDSYNGQYNTVVMKSIVTIMVTALLHILCERGLSIVSWIIVFIPFILMTVIVSILLYAFGLDTATGTLQQNKCKECKDYNNPKEHIIQQPNPIKYNIETKTNFIPIWSSSPAYQTK